MFNPKKAGFECLETLRKLALKGLYLNSETNKIRIEYGKESN